MILYNSSILFPHVHQVCMSIFLINSMHPPERFHVLSSVTKERSGSGLIISGVEKGGRVLQAIDDFS